MGFGYRDLYPDERLLIHKPIQRWGTPRRPQVQNEIITTGHLQPLCHSRLNFHYLKGNY